MQDKLVVAAQTAGDIIVGRVCTVFISIVAVGLILSGNLFSTICGIWILGMLAQC